MIVRILGEGQLEALTGIAERRWWEEGHRLSDGAIAAARRALEASDVRAEQLDAVIYGAVCREYFEPATACRVASARFFSARLRWRRASPRLNSASSFWRAVSRRLLSARCHCQNTPANPA